MIRKGQRLIVDVIRMDKKGRGVALLPQPSANSLDVDPLTPSTPMPISIPNAIPGQKVDIIVQGRRRKKNAEWTGRLVDIVQESTSVAVPKCTKYFGTCGGCSVQHLQYQAQLQIKMEHVENLFAERAFEYPDVQPILGIPLAEYQYHYRNKMEFSVSTKEYKLDHSHEDRLGVAKAYALGLFPKTSGRWNGKVINIEHCYLQSPRANRMLTAIHHAIQHTPGVEISDPEDPEPMGSMALKHVILRTGNNAQKSKEEVMLTLVTTKVDVEILQRFITTLTQALSEEDQEALVSIRNAIHPQNQRAIQKKNNQAQSEELPQIWTDTLLYGREFIYDTIGSLVFRVSGNSFFQPNSRQTSVLYDEILKGVVSFDENGPEGQNKPIVWDLFCGTGSIALYVASAAQYVVGLEIIPDAIADAVENARLNERTNVSFKVMDLSHGSVVVFGHDDPRPDIVIVDPPRAGLHAHLITQLTRDIQPGRVIYVSCNPETQARDIETLCHEKQYQVVSVQPVDMLPHTPHIETVVVLDRVIHV